MLWYVPALPRRYAESLEWSADGQWELRLLRTPGGGAVLVAGLHGETRARQRLQNLGGEVVSDRERLLAAWLQWCLDNCDDSPEYNFGTDATEHMRELLAGRPAPMPSVQGNGCETWERKQ